MPSFGIFPDTAGQRSCWDKFGCNNIKGKMASKELSLHLDRLHSSSSMHLHFKHCFWLVLLFEFAPTLVLSIKSLHVAVIRETNWPHQGRWPCHWKRTTFSAGNSTIFSLWNKKRILTLLNSVKLVYQWWKCCQHWTAQC